MRYIKNFLLLFGALSFSFIVYSAVMFGVVYLRSGDIDKSSKEFVDEAVPAITSNWSVTELKNRATPDLAAFISLESSLQQMSELGPLVNYGGSEGSAKMSVNFFAQKELEANYKASAEFTKEKATFFIGLKNINGQWKISNFKIESPFFGGSKMANEQL